MCAEETPARDRVVCEARRTRSHLLTPWPPGTPPGLSTTARHDGSDSPSTINTATVRPCRIDRPGSPRPTTEPPERPGQGFSATCSGENWRRQSFPGPARSSFCRPYFIPRAARSWPATMLERGKNPSLMTIIWPSLDTTYLRNSRRKGSRAWLGFLFT